MPDVPAPEEVPAEDEPVPASEPEDDMTALVPETPAPAQVTVEVAPEDDVDPEPEPSREPRRVLRKGDEGSDVLAAQQELGAFENGVFDQRMLNFWRNYQQARGVEPTDELDLDNLPADVAKEPMFKE